MTQEMTSPHNKPIFIYSYDPPSPRRRSEYDPPYPEEVLSPYNEKNYLNCELNQSYCYEEQSKANISEELETKVSISNFESIHECMHEKKIHELKSIDDPPCAHLSSPNAYNAQSERDMDLVPSFLSEFSSQTFSEEFCKSSSKTTEICNSVIELSEKKKQTNTEVQSNDCDLIDFSDSYVCREVASLPGINDCTGYSHSNCIINKNGCHSECEERVTVLKHDYSKSNSSSNTETYPTYVVDNESIVPVVDSTTSDVAKCLSPLSTLHSISSLPSDTFTINVPCDWSTSNSDLLSLDFDINIPNTSNGIEDSLSNFVCNSDSSAKNNSTSSFAASVDLSIDSALTSSPPFSPAPTESCTITPLPTDCVTPNSTNPTSTPLPSPVPADLLIATTSESSSSTPSTVTTSDMFCVSKLLEHLSENFVKNDSEANNCVNKSIVNSHCPNSCNGFTANAESEAMFTKKSIVAQLSAIFESRNIKNSLRDIGLGTENFICDIIQHREVKEDSSIFKPHKEGEHFKREIFNASILTNVEEKLTGSSKDMSFEEITEVTYKDINNEVNNTECKYRIDEEDETKNSTLNCSVLKKSPPAPPSRLTSSSEMPPPLPPPPVEECIGETPPIPELPLNFCVYYPDSKKKPPIPPVRQYLLIPLAPGRKTHILFSPPCIPPRSVSLSRTPVIAISPKLQTLNFERYNQDDPFLLNSENLQHNVDELEPCFKGLDQCTKKENGFIQILTPVPEERSSPVAVSPSSLKLSDKEVNDTELLDNMNNEHVTNAINNFNSFNVNELVSSVCDGSHLAADNPPPLPPPPEEQINSSPPPLPPKPCPLKLSAAFFSPPTTPPPPPPKRSKSLSSTPLPKIIFSAPDPFPENYQTVSQSTMIEDSCTGSLSKLDNEQKKLQLTPTLELPIPPAPPIVSSNKTSMTSVSPYGKFVVNRYDLPLLCPEEEVRKVITNAKSYGWINPEDDTLAIYTQVRPIIQQGPQCGLVALSMASQLCSSTVSVEKLLEVARVKEYSTHGEMFSAECMKSLATEAIKDIQASVRTDIFDSPSSLVNTLLNGDFILVPYDADRNHQPGLSLGKKAHWGLICGCLLQSSSMVLKQELTTAKIDVQVDNLWHFRPVQFAKTLSEDRPSSVTPAYPQIRQGERQRSARSVSPNTFNKDIPVISPLTGDDWSRNISNLVVLWRQGKSRNLVMAPFEDLRRSNQQLVEYKDRKDYIIDNIGTTLAGQVVVLHKVKQSLSDLLGALQRDLN